MRRRFNDRERVTLYVAAEGKCENCGRELTRGWHGDHIEPWAVGGLTDIANGQALCPSCNLSKGAKMPNLLGWQTRAYQEYVNHDGPNFLCEATPGAGKTIFAAEVAFRLHKAGVIEKIIWVVPTTRLKKQTAASVLRHTGLNLEYRFRNGDGAMPGGNFAGVVVTYHAVGSDAKLYRLWTSRFRTLVVLDECHHACDDSNWGTALQAAFEPAVRRLLLSGTPFRSDKGAIPFVHYVDGKGRADFSFGYEDALRAGIVRAVYFLRRGGQFEWIDRNGTQSAAFTDELDNEGQSRRLRTALMDKGEHLLGLLRDAHKQLTELRADDPDAAGLVIAMDQTHAQSIAKLMLAEFGIEPVLAISDDPDAADLIETFTNDTAPWIVTVRMVSEGIDIPRLRVGVHATNVATELFFRQAIGRIVRTDGEGTAFYFIPDDPRLRQFAQDIRKQRDAVIEHLIDELLDDNGSGTGPRAGGVFIPLSSTIDDAGAIAGDHEFTPSELKRAQDVKLLSRSTAGVPDVVVAELIRNSQNVSPSAQPEPHQAGDLSEQRKKLRSENQRIVGQIAYHLGVEYNKVNSTLNRQVGIRSVPTCFDLDKLRRRLQLGKQWLSNGQLADVSNG